MEQFEAGNEFIQLVKTHPDDFTAKHETTSDCDLYVIRHKYRAVSITIEAKGTFIRVIQSSTGDSFNYVKNEVLQELLKWAEDRIEEDKIQAKVDKDNSAINTLFEFYENR